VLGVIERVEVVAYGRPASEALAAAIGRAKAAGGALAPVTVIVPSNFTSLTARRLLGAGIVGPGGVVNVNFFTPFRLAELLAADQLLDRRPLTNPVLGAAVRLALAEDPGPFARVADHHATVAALASMYAELSNVSDATLARIEAHGGQSARTAVRFRRAIGAHLAPFNDEGDVARAATNAGDLAALLAPFGSVVWYLPAPATAPMTAFIGAAAQHAPFSVIVGTTGGAEADAAVWATCARAGIDLPGTPAIELPIADTIVSVTDADEEVRAVVRRIAALAEQGVALDRIGVFHPTPDPYVATLEQELAAAGIPANGPTRRKLADSVTGRTLLDALALPAHRWRRDRVMALVSGAPVRDGDELARPTTWERLSREAGVVQGLGDWHRKIAGRQHAVRAGVEGIVAEPDTVDWRLVRADEQLADLARLLAFVDGLAAAVRTVERAQGWPAKSAAATALLHQLLGTGNRHTHWPEAEQQAFERVEDSLSRLATLDELEPDPTHEVFVRALTAELDVTRGRNGRFGQGVLYGPLGSAVGQDLDAVFVLGCAEGLLPAARRDDGMLPDAARALAPGELDLRASRLHEQHRVFLAALASAPMGRRTLTFPRGDLRGRQRALASRWLLHSASALKGDTVYATDFDLLGAPHVDVVSSQAGGLRTTPTHGSLVDRDLAALARFVDAAGALDAHPVAALVARGLQAQGDRRSSRFTEWDGNLVGQPIPSTAERSISPTRLETWAACGYRYFLANVLGLSDRDEPERVLDISPLDRGSGVHATLERFLLEVIEQGVPEPDEPWSPAHRVRLREIAEDVFAEYEARGRTGRPVVWRLTKADVLAMLDEFLYVDDAYRAATRSRPVRVELPFGLGGADPVVLTLPDGRELRFRGLADRVDRADDGRLLVADYKTGRGAKYADIPDGDPVQAGGTLQLGLYAEAAIQQLGAESASATYWMIDTRARFAQFGYDWTPARKGRFLDVTTAIIDGIEGGVFPLVPGEWNTWRGTHDECTYCEFDPVCPRDRGEQAEAKESAVELRVRDRLVWEVAE
jgi:ATP-dependent helicase/nuclease subunit B